MFKWHAPDVKDGGLVLSYRIEVSAKVVALNLPPRLYFDHRRVVDSFVAHTRHKEYALMLLASHPV